MARFVAPTVTRRKQQGMTANYARVREFVQKIITTNIAIFKKGGLPVA